MTTAEDAWDSFLLDRRRRFKPHLIYALSKVNQLAATYELQFSLQIKIAKVESFDVLHVLSLLLRVHIWLFSLRRHENRVSLCFDALWCVDSAHLNLRLLEEKS